MLQNKYPNTTKEYKLQVVKLKPNEGFWNFLTTRTRIEPYNRVVGYGEAIEHIEKIIPEDKYFLLKGSIYIIDRGRELFEEEYRGVNIDDYLEKHKVILRSHPVGQDPPSADMLVIDNFQTPKEEFDKWRKYKYCYGDFKDRKAFDVEIIYLDTLVRGDFETPLFKKYLEVDTSNRRVIKSFVENWGEDFCFIGDEYWYLEELPDKEHKKITDRLNANSTKNDKFAYFKSVKTILEKIILNFLDGKISDSKQDLLDTMAANVKHLIFRGEADEVWNRKHLYGESTQFSLIVNQEESLVSEDIYRVYSWKDFIFFELKEIQKDTKRCKNCNSLLPEGYSGVFCPAGSRNYIRCSGERNRKRQKFFYHKNLTET